MSYLVLDIEAVVDPSLWTEPPKEEWKDGKKPFAPVYAWKPIAIGSMLLDHDFTFRKMGIFGEARGADEEGMVRDYIAYMDEHRPILVTWNGRGYDVPVLNMRAMHYGLTSKWYFVKGTRYRYSEEGHLDLKDQMHDYGAVSGVGLDSMAKVIGLPGKIGVDGSMVGQMYADGKIKEIRDYCLCDVVQTAFVLLRWRLFSGELSLERYRMVAEQLLDETQENPATKELAGKVDRKVLLLET
jgi:hypothetical protein